MPRKTSPENGWCEEANSTCESGWQKPSKTEQLGTPTRGVVVANVARMRRCMQSEPSYQVLVPDIIFVTVFFRGGALGGGGVSWHHFMGGFNTPGTLKCTLKNSDMFGTRKLQVLLSTDC